MNRNNKENVCAYAGCNKHIENPKYFLCPEHHERRKEGIIDQCPKCGKFKDAHYKQCLDCYHHLPIKKWTPPADFATPVVEHSHIWDKGDKDTNRFYAYILKLDGGKFYSGHTRDLRERVGEHIDGLTASIKGLNPRLQYFEIFGTRDEAAIREAELKKLIESNPRQIRLMVNWFHDLVDDLNWE
jgi:predicted GIY-YIG superfamily endonuclease